MEDLEILRGYSEGFSDPSRLEQTEIYMSYARAHKFMEQFFYKAQRMENRLDDIVVLLSEAGNYETLHEHLPIKEMNLSEIKA